MGSVRGHRGRQRHEGGTGPGPVSDTCAHARRGPRRSPRRAATHRLLFVPSGGRPGCTAGPGARANSAPRAPTRALDRHPTGRDVLQGEKCTPPPPAASTDRARRGEPHPVPNADRRPTAARRLNLARRPFGFLRFTPERFHVLLNSLFKVLFNFPSRYLFAIGLVVVFSLRWSLPPA